VERDSEHTIAQGVVKSAEEKGITIPRAEQFKALPGEGVEALVENRTLMLGGPALLRRLKIALPPELQAGIDDAARRGQTVITLIEGDRALSVLAVADAIREESLEAVKRLHQQGIEVIMMTGDAQSVAESVASELGIDTVFAEVLPEQKAGYVRRLQAEGKRVAMVGDGVNDAPALAQADVGIAIGAGTDVAIETAKVVLMKSDPLDIMRAYRLSRATVTKMNQNLFWASIYNVLAIPIAAGVLYPRFGIMLRPEWSALLMSVSSIIVATNAVLLKREDGALSRVGQEAA
jgi:P-type Cu2+ transporter